MMQNHNLARRIADASWAMLDTFITYKAEWQGKNVIHIPRFEPSSKRCSDCGYINDNLTLADREWTCPECGIVHSRDTNAAIVIKDVGLKMALGSNWLPNRKLLLPARQVMPQEPMERNQ
jgi:putative transposase